MLEVSSIMAKTLACRFALPLLVVTAGLFVAACDVAVEQGGEDADPTPVVESEPPLEITSVDPARPDALPTRRPGVSRFA